LTLTKPFVDDNRLRDRVGPTIRRSGSGGVGGSTTSDVGRVAAFAIGGVELPHTVVQLFGDSAGVLSQRGPWVGNIGGGILRRFTVLLDYQNKRMIFEPNARIGEPSEADMSGAGLVTDESLSSIIVDAVAPGSPAAEAGLMHADVIVSVDGVPASHRLLGELRERFRRAGERAVLMVRRGAETKRIEVVTRRMV
jgi:membrane-associated protease RseP (regulator of RpoE activity)